MARKRKAGDGTVRQRKDGRWEGRIVIGYDDNGYPKTKNVLAKTKKECVEKLQKLKEECGGLKLEKVRPEMAFGDWLTYWYENHSKPKIRPTTQETYESRIRLHIIPEIGDIPLNKLTQNDLQQFYGRLKKSGRKRFADKYGEGLSDRMVCMCHATCRSALEKAVQAGLIPCQPGHRLQAAAQEGAGDAGADAGGTATVSHSGKVRGLLRSLPSGLSHRPAPG